MPAGRRSRAALPRPGHPTNNPAEGIGYVWQTTNSTRKDGGQMRLRFKGLAALTCLAGLAAAQTKSAKTLDIYFIDTEGGLSALYVSPTGESLLIDTGNPGGRDTDRIMEAAH